MGKVDKKIDLYSDAVFSVFVVFILIRLIDCINFHVLVEEETTLFMLFEILMILLIFCLLVALYLVYEYFDLRKEDKRISRVYWRFEDYDLSKRLKELTASGIPLTNEEQMEYDSIRHVLRCRRSKSSIVWAVSFLIIFLVVTYVAFYAGYYWS
jgi:hypothetical protein